MRSVMVNTTEYPSLRAAAKVHGWDGQTQRHIARCLRDRDFFNMNAGVRIRWKTPGRKQRARKQDKGVDSKLRKEVLAYRGRVCEKCGRGGRVEVDHIKPRAEGGGDELTNLMVLCVGCHAEKSGAENAARKASAPKPVTIRGITYDSLHKAAAALGVDRAQIRGHMQRGTLDRVGTKRQDLRLGVTLMVPVNVGGTLYPSRVRAATVLGVNPKQISRRILHAHDCWCMNTYMETWKWHAMEQHAFIYDDSEHRNAKCSRCGDAAARRLVTTETYTDLSLNPFRQPTDPVCARCERVIARLRKPEVKRANRETAERILGMEPTVPLELDPDRVARFQDPGRSPYGCPVVVAGHEFPTCRHAARAMGIENGGQAIRQALDKGNDTWRGIEIAWAGGRKRKVMYGNFMDRSTVTVRGTVYRSPQACAEALGMSVASVKRAMRKGLTDRLGNRGRRTITVRGVDHHGWQACADALGVTKSHVITWVRRGDPDMIGLVPTERAMPLTVNGVEYPSRRAAAEALNVSYCTLHRHLAAGTLEQAVADGFWSPRNGKPVTVNGVEYPSLRAAARVLDIVPSYVGKLAAQGRLDGWKRQRAKKRGGSAGSAVPRPRSRSSVKG